jgi:hypothetical protein
VIFLVYNTKIIMFNVHVNNNSLIIGKIAPGARAQRREVYASYLGSARE